MYTYICEYYYICICNCSVLDNNSSSSMWLAFLTWVMLAGLETGRNHY